MIGHLCFSPEQHREYISKTVLFKQALRLITISVQPSAYTWMEEWGTQPLYIPFLMVPSQKWGRGTQA